MRARLYPSLFDGPFLNCGYEHFPEHQLWISKAFRWNTRSGLAEPWRERDLDEPKRSWDRTRRALSLEVQTTSPHGARCAAFREDDRRDATKRKLPSDASAAPHRQQAVRHRRRGLPTCRLRPSRVDPGPTTTQAPRDHRATAHRSGARRPRLPYLCAPAVSHTHSPSPLQRLPEHDVRRRAASRATRASSCRRLPVRAGIRR